MNDVKAIDNERVPYQLPMPKDALSEIVVPDALAKEDDRMWVQQAQNVYFRPLCLNISQGLGRYSGKEVENTHSALAEPTSDHPLLQVHRGLQFQKVRPWASEVGRERVRYQWL